MADYSERKMERKTKKRTVSPKLDRKTAERNRRIEMKTLCSKLNSLLPNHSLREVTILWEQLDEATNYIKVLQEKLEKLKERKEHLMKVVEINESMNNGCMMNLQSPHVEIQDLGLVLAVVLICGLDNQLLFYKSIRILEEEGAEVVNAGFSIMGDKIVHTMHCKIPDSKRGFEAARISERLHNLVHEVCDDL